MTKSQRINLRASEREEAVLRRAASAAEESLSEFILGSAVQRAERVLADRTAFAVSPEQFDLFVEMLDRPVETPKLAALFARRDVFGTSIDIDD